MTTQPVPSARPASSDGRPLLDRLSSAIPILVLTPSLVASFVYVFVFTGWTLYISLSNSTLLPSYDFVGLKNYNSLWANRRWGVAYTNLFVFSAFYVVLAMLIGLMLAILIGGRVRAESVGRTRVL